MTLSTSVSSNAFNFTNFINSQVDPRTGQYTCAINLPELKANNLCGPTVPLQLNFNPLNNSDSGFGKGWNLQLSQFNPANGILSLYTGETFKINLQESEVLIPEKKLDSFHFHVLGNNRYRIEHKSGLIEILQVGQSQLAMPVQILSQQGHSVTLDYEAFSTEPLLSSIKNTDGSLLLSLKRTLNEMNIVLHAGTASESLFLLNIQNGETRSIVLPTDDNASWQFTYILSNEFTCLQHIYTPTGGHEKVIYAAQPHNFPGITDRKLPRVYSHIQDPGFAAPAIETRFTYGSKAPDNTNDHNFLGFGSGIDWIDNGLDNLYKVRSGYEYETQEELWEGSRAIRTTRRVYNRFHLMVREEVMQKAALASDDTLLVTETEYYINPFEAFEDQPEYCQLPKSVTRTWRKNGASSPRHTEVVSTTYDTFGNLLTQINANGVKETCTWYGLDAEEGCPADPQKFVRNLKSKTVTPAPSNFGDAPTLQHRYTYTEHNGLADNAPWLALSEEALVQVVEGKVEKVLRTIAHEYLNEPDTPQRHGLISKTVLTVNDRADTRTTTTFDYKTAYNARANVATLSTVSTLIGFDDDPEVPGKQVRQVTTEEHSLLTGAKLSSKDGNGAEIIYLYDRLGRTTQEIVAPGTHYEASRDFRYSLTNGTSGQQAVQYSKDVKGVQTRTWFDGLNRVLKEDRQDIDALGGDAQLFRPTYSATYNQLGQLTQETAIDWEDSKDIHLTTTYQYDAWGEQCKVTGPDGVAQLTENDPANQTWTTWTQGTGAAAKVTNKSRKTLNLFGKEDKVEALDANGEWVSERQYFYDGLGNCAEQLNEMGETTRFIYDKFSRMQVTIMPDQTEIHRAYAPHSIGELPVSIDVAYGSFTTSVGSQTYDGLDRRSTVEVGKRLQQFLYEGGQSQVSKLITADQKTINYAYTPGLVDTPVSSTAPDETSTFGYDPQSAQLTLSQNLQSEHTFEYNFCGQLRTETWKDKVTGKQSTTVHTQTLNGRPLTRVDNNGMTCTYTYDHLARLKSATQGQIFATFDYDDLGQVSHITTNDESTGQSLITALTYDDQGRETKRHMTLSGDFPTQTITQTYRDDNRLETRLLQRGEHTELMETFVYDQRGRMVEQICEGTNLPQDRFGNAIYKQAFTFDALDNITAVYTRFADGTQDDAISEFASNDPCQLVKVTHSHPHYPSACELEYDNDGNLVRDETGQTLHYDSQSRLVKVTDADGNDVTQYRYDAHNHLQGVKRGTQAETLRFYQDDRLCRTEHNGIDVHYLYLNDQPLAQQQDDAEHTLLLMVDGKNSVLGETGQGELRKATYGSYGERNSNDEMQCSLGYNGEVRDEQSGWYLLGQGYRAYNPTLMRFHSPDSLSPFGAGGINPYVYCAGDPINFVDPTGHANRGVNWMGVLGAALSAVGIALTIAAVVIAPPVGAVAIASTTAFTGIGVGGGAYGIYEGVMATTATRLKDREKHETSSLISGGLDVAFGAYGLYAAVRVAKSAAAAQVSWHKQVQESLGKVENVYAARNASRNAGGAIPDVPASGSRGSSASTSGGANGVSDMPTTLSRSVAGPSGFSNQVSTTSSPVSETTALRGPRPEVPPKPTTKMQGSVEPGGNWFLSEAPRNPKLNDIGIPGQPALDVPRIRALLKGKLSFHR